MSFRCSANSTRTVSVFIFGLSVSILGFTENCNQWNASNLKKSSEWYLHEAPVTSCSYTLILIFILYSTAIQIPSSSYEGKHWSHCSISRVCTKSSTGSSHSQEGRSILNNWWYKELHKAQLTTAPTDLMGMSENREQTDQWSGGDQ